MTHDCKSHRTATNRPRWQSADARGRTWTALLVAGSLALVGILLSACSSQGSSSPSSAPAQQTDSTTDTSTEAEATAQSAEDERQAEIERLTTLEAAYLQSMETKDDWADEVLVDALNALADEGAIAPLPEDFELFDNVFEFKETDDGYDIDYLDEGAKTRLTGDFALDLTDGSTIAICTELHMADTPEKRGIDVSVLYTDKDGAFSTNIYIHDEKLLATPTLKPFGEKEMGTFLDLSIPDEVYADSPEECRYLIAYAGCDANVIEDYYAITINSPGTIDRTDVTTIVLVVDAQTRTVLHIENIGTSIPEKAGDLMKGDNYGDMLMEEARDYMSELVLNGSSSV